MDDAPQQSLPKTFDPAQIEARWYAHWEKSGGFRPHRPDATPFTIVNPPPNVTGSLHIGHALDNTLQDILVRYERLRGKDALWVVGTDHAGIATQMVVERQMAQRQEKRTDFTRDEFVAKVWDWKHESGGTITRQLRRLGCSMDWSREQFTMDPHFTAAVTKVFVDLYNKGLIYRDKRLVNWDPDLKTAISDLEVETRETNGHFWHFEYPLVDGPGIEKGASIKVATTRPETMLADMVVAVHPADERYAAWVGKMVKLPITRREIPIVADEHADPELGSGAVKITPGHDFNDFEVGKRAGIAPADMLNMLDADAKVAQTSDGLIPDAYLGLSREDARKKVVAAIDELGLLGIVEDRVIQVPLGDRSGQVIEPWLTDQWYVDAQTLAGPAIAAVKSGEVAIVPQSWEKTFYHWMENIQPWCVSRQLWWGHRIPAWYGPRFEDGRFKVNVSDTTQNKVFVAETIDDLIPQLNDYYGSDCTPVEVQTWGDWKNLTLSIIDEEFRAEHGHKIFLVRDPDVLDTWFSSALWPFATLGWPNSSPSPDGEGDHAQHGGGVGSAAMNTPPPSSTVPLPGEAGEDRHIGGVRYHLPAKTNAAVLRAKAMRRAMPPSETTLWNALKDRPGGLKFRRQHPAGDYVLDFFCPAAGIAIEVDGEAHNRGTRPDRDHGRDIFLRECGVDTLRIPARAVFEDVDAVVAGIIDRAQARLPLHQPSAGPPPRQAGEDLFARHYPNDVLVSGFDILFFWDARMLMQGIELTGTPPWKTLYLHGLVRAADGQKMSKSKGNTVDPLGLIDQYGADALRFFMAAMESQGRDIKMDDARLAGYRNFATKLWNAARFCEFNGIGASTDIAAPPASLAVNKWIVGEVAETAAKIETALAAYRFDDAANAIYHFTWDRFCDWYLELIKGAIDDETKAVAGWALDQILVMLHPFMPFITEELWHAMAKGENGRGDYDLITAKWVAPEAEADKDAAGEIDWLISLIAEIRSLRNELNIPFGTWLNPDIINSDEKTRLRFSTHSERLKRMVRLANPGYIDSTQGAGPGTAQIVIGEATIAFNLEDYIDLAAERTRLTKSLAAAAQERDGLTGRLSNPAFVERAKPEAVEKARADHAEKSAEADRLQAALARLG